MKIDRLFTLLKKISDKDLAIMANILDLSNDKENQLYYVNNLMPPTIKETIDELMEFARDFNKRLLIKEKNKEIIGADEALKKLEKEIKLNALHDDSIFIKKMALIYEVLGDLRIDSYYVSISQQISQLYSALVSANSTEIISQNNDMIDINEFNKTIINNKDSTKSKVENLEKIYKISQEPKRYYEVCVNYQEQLLKKMLYLLEENKIQLNVLGTHEESTLKMHLIKKKQSKIINDFTKNHKKFALYAKQFQVVEKLKIYVSPTNKKNQIQIFKFEFNNVKNIFADDNAGIKFLKRIANFLSRLFMKKDSFGLKDASIFKLKINSTDISNDLEYRNIKKIKKLSPWKK